MRVDVAKGKDRIGDDDSKLRLTYPLEVPSPHL